MGVGSISPGVNPKNRCTASQIPRGPSYWCARRNGRGTARSDGGQPSPIGRCDKYRRFLRRSCDRVTDTVGDRRTSADGVHGQSSIYANADPFSCILHFPSCHNLVSPNRDRMATYKALQGPLAAIFVGSIACTVSRKPVFLEASETAGGSPSMSQPGAPAKVFSSGPAMVSLRLKSSENLNHNVKLIRFEYPKPDATSGLSLTCKRLDVYQSSQVLTCTL